MSLLVLSGWQGVERPPRTQARSVKPFTRRGLMPFLFLFRCCFSQARDARWDSSSQEEYLKYFPQKIRSDLWHAHLFFTRYDWQLTCRLCGTGKLFTLVSSQLTATKQGRSNCRKEYKKWCSSPPSSSSSSTGNQFFVGLRLILVLSCLPSDPWHIWSCTQTWVSPFSLLKASTEERLYISVRVCVLSGTLRSKLWEAVVVRCNERERDPWDGENRHCSFWRRGLQTWRQTTIPAGAPGAFDVGGWSDTKAEPAQTCQAGYFK